MDYEAKVQALYEKVLGGGHIAVDVGAHAGRHMFPMAQRVGSGGHVYAFEPIPAMHRDLHEEIKRLNLTAVIDLYPYAASTEDGESEFVVAVDNPGYSGLKERVYDTPTRIERIRVQMRRLDNVLAKLDRMRFLKIDVEGGEWGVIKGATELITRCRPVVAFEFGQNSYEKYGVDPYDVWDFFAERKYGMRDILGNVIGERDQFMWSSKLQKIWDYAAIPAEMPGDALFA